MNGNGKYSAEDLKGGYTGNDFLVLEVYRNEKGSSMKIQLMIVLKDHHIVTKARPTTVGYINGYYIMSFGRSFTMVITNTSLNEVVFSNVPMSAKFYNVLCHKCFLYFMAAY